MMNSFKKSWLLFVLFALMLPCFTTAVQARSNTSSPYQELIPGNFIQVPNEALDVSAEDISGQSFSNSHFFLLTHEEDLSLIAGFSTQLNTDDDKNNFQALIDLPEDAARAFGNFYQAEGFTKRQGENEFTPLDTLGKKQVAIRSLLEKTDGTFITVDIIAFEKMGTGVYLVNLYPLSSEEKVSFKRFASAISESIERIASTDDQETPTCFYDERIFFDIDIENSNECETTEKPQENLYSTTPELGWLSPGEWITDAFSQDRYEAVIYKAATLADMKITEAVLPNIDYQTGDMEISEEELKAFGIEYETLFAYSDVETQPSRDINLIGYTQRLPTYESIGQANTEDLTPLLNKFATMIGATGFRNYRLVYYINEKVLGRVNSVAMVADLNGKEYRLELVKFHRDGIAVTLFTSRIRPEEENLDISSSLITNVTKNILNKLLFTNEFRRDFQAERLISDAEIGALPLPEVDLQPYDYSATSVNIATLLPQGTFVETPDFTLNASTDDFSGQSFSNYDPFIFIGVHGDHQLQHLYGFTTTLRTFDDRQKFQAIIDNPEEAAKAFARFYGGTVKSGVEGKYYPYLGDTQVDLNFIMAIEEYKNPKFDLVAFSKGDVGVYMLYEYSEYDSGIPVFPELPTKLSRKISANSTDALLGAFFNKEIGTYMLFEHAGYLPGAMFFPDLPTDLENKTPQRWNLDLQRTYDVKETKEKDTDTQENISTEEALQAAFRDKEIGVYLFMENIGHNRSSSLYPSFQSFLRAKAPQKTIIRFAKEEASAANSEDSQSILYETLAFQNIMTTSPYTDWLTPGFPSFGYDRMVLRNTAFAQESWKELGLHEDSYFIFEQEENNRLIISYNFYFQTFEEIALFDEDYDLDEPLTKILLLLDAQLIGDYQRPAQMISDRNLQAVLVEIDGKKYVAEIFKKREENIGFVYFTLQEPYDANPRYALRTINVGWQPYITLYYSKPFREPYQDKLKQVDELAEN